MYAIRSYYGEDRSGSERLDLLARQQADQQAGLDTLRVEFQSVQGRFEDQARESGQLRDDLALMRDDLALKVTALEDRLARLEELGKAPAPEQAPAETSEALYERGLELIQKKEDFAGGRQWLQQFLHVITSYSIHYTKLYEEWINSVRRARLRMVSAASRMAESSSMRGSFA